MANKVIQLKNKAGTDNLFPIAGGVTQDTITTAMIQDGAVTASKLEAGIIKTHTIDVQWWSASSTASNNYWYGSNITNIRSWINSGDIIVIRFIRMDYSFAAAASFNSRYFKDDNGKWCVSLDICAPPGVADGTALNSIPDARFNFVRLILTDTAKQSGGKYFRYVALEDGRKILYSDSNPRGGVSTTDGHIALNDTILNYDRLGIYYRSAFDFSQNYTEVRVVDTQNTATVASLVSVYCASDGAGNFKLAQVNFSGMDMYVVGTTELPYGATQYTSGDKVYVTKVIGLQDQQFTGVLPYNP